MPNVEPGKWYFAVTCKNDECRKGNAIMECPPIDVPVGVDREEFDFACPACGTNSHYHMSEVTRVQGQSKH